MVVQERPGDVIVTRPLHIIWIADCSGSMAGNRIQTLNQAIRDTIPEMRRVAQGNPNVQILVRAVKFSKGAQWHISQPTPIDDFKWEDLTADSITDKDMGEALCLVAEQLKISNIGDHAFAPVLLLVSDGQPTDDFSASLKNLMQERWGQKAIRMAIAIGKDADLDILQKFIGNPELKPLLAGNPEELVHHIKFVSSNVLIRVLAPPNQLKRQTPAEPAPAQPIPIVGPRTTDPGSAIPNIPITNHSNQQKALTDDIGKVVEPPITAHRYEWYVVGESIRGNTHILSGKPNQDSIEWFEEQSDRKFPIVLAVADGHGSPKNFRSDTGSRLATSAAISVCTSLAKNNNVEINLVSIKQGVAHDIAEEPFVKAEVALIREIVQSWRNLVADDLEKNPFTEAEIEQLEKQVGVLKKREVILNPVLAYGTTLITTILFESYAAYLQLGDGNIVTVYENGDVLSPLTHTELLGEQTESLCLPNAWKYFLVSVQAFAETAPILIMLSTDGYKKSFAKAKGFLKVGPHIVEMVRANGLAILEDNLVRWLTETSKEGSGDDITAGILLRKDILDVSNIVILPEKQAIEKYNDSSITKTTATKQVSNYNRYINWNRKR